jgi:hypothetical protein
MMLTLIVEGRPMLAHPSSKESMLNQVVLERSCQHDANLSSRESMLNLVVLERSCQHDASLNSRGETHANP